MLHVSCCTFVLLLVKCNHFVSKQPAHSGGMDWWHVEWPCSRVQKIFSSGRILQENPRNSAERVENAPTCYRAPRWSDPEFPQKKCRTNTPPARNSGTPRNTEKKKMVLWGYFFGIFLGVFSWCLRVASYSCVFLNVKSVP